MQKRSDDAVDGIRATVGWYNDEIARKEREIEQLRAARDRFLEHSRRALGGVG